MKQDWEIRKLGEVCDLYQPKTISSKEMVENGDYPVFGANGIIGKYNSYNHEDPQLLITCRGATCGSVNISKPKSWINGNAMVVRPIDSSLGLKYVEYFFRGGIDISKIITGAAQPQITRQTLSPVLISYPKSLRKQQRIVAVLDEACAAIDKAKANAEQNLNNTKELHESFLQGVFDNKGEGWENTEFGQFIITLTDYHANGSYKILKQNVELKETGDFAWMVRSTDFEKKFQNNFRFIDEKAYDFLSKSKVFGREIIMSKIGNAGNVYLMPEVERPCSLAMNLFLIRLDETKAIPHFVFHYLKSYSGDFQIKSRLNGATTKTITKENVRNIIIPLPPLIVQQAIVQKLDALSSKTRKLEIIYQKKIKDLEELKKSVLQKAFSGELKSIKEVAI